MTETKEYTCKICGEICQSSILFTYHLKKQHNLSRKEYFDKYVEPIEHKCPFCDNERKWYLNQYRNTCGSKDCNAKWSHQRMQEIYGVENISQLKWVKDKKRKTCNEHFGCDNPSQAEQVKIKKENTCLQNHGVKYPQQSKSIQEHTRKTCREIYHHDYPTQSEEVKQKIHNTLVENHGECYYKSEEYQEKYRASCRRNNGVDYPMQSPTIRQKMKDRCMEKYDMPNGGGTEEAIRKIKESKRKNHGDENYCNPNKIRETFNKNYGCHPMQTEECKQKVRNTCFEHHGVEYYAQSPEYHKKAHKRYTNPKYPDMTFDRSWEFKVYDFLTERNIPFEYQPAISIPYECEGTHHTYHPDFLVNDRIVEVKGDNFFRINEETGKEEMYLTWQGKLSDEEYEWKCKIMEAKHQCMLANNVIILRKNEIAHLEDIFLQPPLHQTPNMV